MEELEELIEDADRDGSGSVDFQVVFLGGIPGSFLGGFPGSLLGRFPGSFTNSSERLIFFYSGKPLFAQMNINMGFACTF